MAPSTNAGVPPPKLLTRPKAQEALMAVIRRMPSSWFDHYWGKAIVAVLKAVATCSADVGIPQHALTMDLQKKRTAEAG
jgi:hypothetical protein